MPVLDLFSATKL